MTQRSCIIVMITMLVFSMVSFAPGEVGVAGADGPAPCSSGTPSYGYQGFCGTYNGNNTWYGFYGLGFPTPLGWGLCANPPASGADYPSPSYQYSSASPPQGADTNAFNSAGFALSQAGASGMWNGVVNLFTANQAAVAATLFYDTEVWGDPVPSMDGGVTAAYNQLSLWNTAAQGANAPPVLSVSLTNPTVSSPLASQISGTLAFPGTTSPVPNVSVTLTLTNATFGNGTSSDTLTTSTQGTVSEAITATGAGPVELSATAATGQLGLLFWIPTVLDTAAQTIAAPLAQTQTSSSAQVNISTELYVQKYNAVEPNEGVPGAVYNLYVQGTPPTPIPPTPSGMVVPAGLTWYATGVTNAGGHLAFPIPSGYSWCVQEVSTPPEFVLDPALHCSGVITSASPDPVRTVAVAETESPITLTAYKFNAAEPGVVLPGASYALFVDGTFPSGFIPPTAPPGILVPEGMELFATGTTDQYGKLVFSLPSGHRWCLQELVVPAGYLLDTGLHCSGVLTTSSSELESTIALPELAMTGTTIPWPLISSLVTVGALLLAWSKRRKRTMHACH